MSEKVKFINKEKTDFFGTVRKRVDKYFEDTGISRHANAAMIFKTIGMFTMFFGPYALILTNSFSPWAMFGLTAIMGFGVAGIGLSVMHDANHGGYSSSATTNKIIGYCMNLIGGCACTWKIQHNVLHHTFTNIYHHDEDLDPSGAMRFTPSADYKPMFRYQHIYATFLYGLMTMMWVLHKDFKQLKRYSDKNLIKGVRGTYKKELAIIIFSKIFYYFYILLIPMLLVDISIFQWLAGFLLMHFITGVVLGYVFQMAHVIEETHFPEPKPGNSIENEWAIHQMYTTANFARKNKLLSWYVGGLNYQVEHHLFPKICHIHYSKLANIVKRTAEEFNIPYYDHPTFWSAIRSHFRLMKKLGQPNPVLVAGPA